MSKIITKRIIPILLLVMLCIGMFPTAFAEAEITIADTSASTQIEVVQDSSGADITALSLTTILLWSSSALCSFPSCLHG